MALPVMALAAASAGMSLLGSMSQVSAQNKYALANSKNARQAAAYKQDQEMESYIESNRQMLMGSMDRALQARSNSDLAMVSMFETGGGGQVMSDMLGERRAVEARNIYRDRLERNSMKIQTNRNLKGYENEAKGRIAGSPTTSLNFGHIMQAGAKGLPHLT
jgi:hypothetical protein